MKRAFIFMSTTLLLLLVGCQAIIDREQNNIMSTKVPTPTLEVTPTPEPMTEKDAVEIYVSFLDNEIPFYWADGSAAYFSDLCWERQGARAEAIQGLTVRDLTGDGIPELCAAPHSLNDGGGTIWTIREGRVEYLDGLSAFYEQLLPNGGIFYYRPGAAPLHNDYAYRWLSPESHKLPELGFSTYDSDQDGEMDRYYIGDLEIPIFTEDEEVTREEWEETTAPYFALWEAEPTEEQQSRPFLDWAIDMGVDISSLLILAPWQEAYRDILLYPEKYEEFYAVAEHVPSDRPKLVTYYQEETVPRTYAFAICDVNADGVAELLLQGASPRVLLNILRYNEETGIVEDLDGPRTYPLMDTLGFFDTGYFSTMNGAGGLYTEFWHLEDEDPDHYWYGYERSATFNDDGELESILEFPFESSDGKEKFTLQEYYELLGENGCGAIWQELTDENIQKAFWAAGGEEEP